MKASEHPIKKKKTPPMPILAEYVINAKTMLGVQAVHRDSKCFTACKMPSQSNSFKIDFDIRLQLRHF